MGVIGSSGGGYATVNPTQGNPMGEALQNVENSAFKYNAIKREEEQAKLQAERELQENRRRDFNESQQFSKENPFVATGTGLDAVNRQSYMNAKDAADKAYTDYMKSGDNKHKAVYENAIASVNNLTNIPKQINALKESWVENAKDYNPNSLKSKAVILDQIASGQIVQSNDANGNPRYTVFEKDENGNVSKLIQKEITGEQLIKSLNPEKAFNVDGKDGFIDLFNKNIGKERKVIEGTGLNAVEKTYNPGADELAKIMANDAVNDHSKMYETLSRMGLDPENEKNYSDPKVRETASKYLEDMLMMTAPTTISQKPDTSLATLEESKRQHRETNRRADRNEAKQKSGSQTVTESQAINNITGKPMYDKDGNPIIIKKTSVTTPLSNKKTNPTTAKNTAKAQTKPAVPSYSIKDLKANGWNDAQIKQAVKEGKIKTK